MLPTDFMATLGDIADLLAAIGVIFSIYYLARQVKQNTDAVKNSTFESISSAGAEIGRFIAGDADLARIYRLGTEDLTGLSADEQLRFSALLVYIFRTFENLHYQYSEGVFCSNYWDPWKDIIIWFFNRPGVVQWWPSRRATFQKRFVLFLETTPRNNQAEDRTF